MKVGSLWASENCGLYSNAPFEDLFRNIGQNNGNLAFVHAIKSQIDADFHHYAWHARPEVMNNDADFIVIPCANQLGKHTDLGGLAKNLAQVTKPIIAIGLGAQANEFGDDIELTPGTKEWLDVIIENGKKHSIQNIYTRGPYTSDQIKKLTGVETLPNGCPSHFMNPRPDLGQRIQRNWENNALPQRIAVAGGHEAWEQTREVEQQLIAMMMDPTFPGVYIVQSMGDMIKMSRGLFEDIETEALNRLHKHTVPHYTPEQFKDWALTYSRSYYDIAAWMDELRRYDILIGPRFHGAQLAIQAERMACTVTIDTRTEEMCLETGVPFLRAQDLKQPLTRSRLRELLPFDGEGYDSFRAKKCAKYCDFLVSAGLPPKKFLKDIAATT